MWIWIVIGTGTPVALAVGLVVGGVLAHRDARRDGMLVGQRSTGDAAGDAVRTARWSAAVVLAGWIVPLVLSALLIGRFQWWPTLLPIVAAVLGAAVVSARAASGARGAGPRVLDLRHRGPLTFAPRPDVVAAVVVAVLLVLTVVAAGSLSSRDDTGRWAIVELPVGDMTAATEFFGWYYGVPVVAAMLVLAAATWSGLHRVARAPRTAEDRPADDLARRIRSSALLRGATAGLLVTLGSAWQLVAAASQLRTEVPRTSVGTIEFGTSFAAVGAVGGLVAHCAVGVGVGLLVAQLLRGRRLRHRAAASDPSAPSTV